MTPRKATPISCLALLVLLHAKVTRHGNRALTPFGQRRKNLRSRRWRLGHLFQRCVLMDLAGQQLGERLWRKARGATDEQRLAQGTLQRRLDGRHRQIDQINTDTHRHGLDLAVREVVLARRSLQRVPRVDVRILVLLNQPESKKSASVGQSAELLHAQLAGEEGKRAPTRERR